MELLSWPNANSFPGDQRGQSQADLKAQCPGKCVMSLRPVYVVSHARVVWKLRCVLSSTGKDELGQVVCL